MSRKLKLWTVALLLAVVCVWAGVAHYREQARLARQAQLQAERAEREKARAKAYIELRTPDEIAADKARAAAEQAKRDGQARAAAQLKELQAAQAKIDEIKRDRAMRYAIAGARALKQGMKDPDSFRLNAATLQDDGAVCFQYRGKNSFGATVPGRFVIDPNGNPHNDENRDSSFAAAWAAHCQSIGEEVAGALKRSGAI